MRTYVAIRIFDGLDLNVIDTDKLSVQGHDGHGHRHDAVAIVCLLFVIFQAIAQSEIAIISFYGRVFSLFLLLTEM